MKSFKDKIAVITGAGSGIGQALSLELAKKGAVLILSDKNAEGLADTESKVKTIGADCYTYSVDVSNEKAIKDFVNTVLKEHRHIDLLFNNAGFALGKISMQQVKMEDFRKIVDVNMWGVINHTKEFLDTLISRPEAVIVNISSLFGIVGVPDQVPYCTTKFAVRGFTEALRADLYNTNVEVYCVHPGGINTNIYKNAVHYESNPSLDKKFQKALERTSPEDAAKTILKHIEKKNERVLIGIDAEMGDRLARTMPVGYTKLIMKVFNFIAK
ncbi:MAG TPA: SDR family oxidoreductase [Chitinophagales bacterium]|nr:SDR family oxidoreductase [Chitinophagales bacterium]